MYESISYPKGGSTHVAKSLYEETNYPDPALSRTDTVRYRLQRTAGNHRRRPDLAGLPGTRSAAGVPRASERRTNPSTPSI